MGKVSETVVAPCARCIWTATCRRITPADGGVARGVSGWELRAPVGWPGVGRPLFGNSALVTLLSGWSRTREVAGTAAVPHRAVPRGALHAVDAAKTSVAICGAVVLVLGPSWSSATGSRCPRCQKLAQRW